MALNLFTPPVLVSLAPDMSLIYFASVGMRTRNWAGYARVFREIFIRTVLPEIVDIMLPRYAMSWSCMYFELVGDLARVN